MDNDYRIKPLSKVIPKSSTYVKIYDGETKWIYFLIKDYELLKSIMIFGSKPAIAYEQI